MDLVGQILALCNLNLYLAIWTPENTDDVNAGTQTLPALHRLVASAFEGRGR
jgi:hypothetical protein